MTNPASPRPPADALDEDRLVEIGRALFVGRAEAPALTTVRLPEGLGICLVHAVRGGGKVYVAPDGSVLFVGSALDFDAGLATFRAGARTLREASGSERHLGLRRAPD
ncbi:hypothetical protein ACSMX9_29360 [Streptomyces sp. LE64]|uniref:hypothetical protein n=1 Tax=unclassified Streptomyces TaxID=2593676 RepID=UPI00342D66DA